MARAQKLTPEVLEDFKRRGLTRKDAEVMRVTVTRKGFAIPYLDKRGKPTDFFRERILNSGDGPKYLQPEGTNPEAYFPPNVKSAAWRDVRAPLLVTEGEIKSYVASKYGFPCLGLGGVYGWMQNGQPLPALDAIKWQDRTVYIVFDSDAASNSSVRMAEDRLVAELRARGADARIIRLPAAADGSKQGVDDFLVAKGKKALRDLLKDAAEQPSMEDVLQRRFTLDEMKQEAIYLSGRDTVTLISQSWIDCSAEHFKRLTAASKETIQTPNGPKVRGVAELWLENPQRKTVDERTFCPGADVLCTDPNGRTAVNTWRAVAHTPPKGWKQRVQPFIDHLRYLIPGNKEREQFLLWVAHLIQYPGDMPPWHVLMFTEGAQGIGRNWLAALIGAIVRPYAALHVDIGAMAGNAHGAGFNGELSGKIYCCVDELHASAFAHGGRRMMEALKVTLTAETRLLNPKYGRQTVEFNRLRVMILSNHRDAMPLDIDDRRFMAIRNPDVPKPADYYAKIYALLRDPEFIAACWKYLSTLPLPKLVMGRAPVTVAKADLIEATEPEYITKMREALTHSKLEMVTTTAAKEIGSNMQGWQVQQAMRAVNAAKYPKRVSLGNNRREYVWVLRNHETWLRASDAAVRKYLTEHVSQLVNLSNLSTKY